MQKFSLAVLSMTEYLGNGDAGAQLVPAIPAIYLWTVDLTRLARLGPADAGSELDRLIRLPVRTFEGRIIPCYDVAIADVPASLSSDRAAKLRRAFERGGPSARWVLLYATALQRPLYVGQASNLNNRFRTHVRAGSVLRGYLDEAGLTLRDCSLAYIELPSALDFGDAGEPSADVRGEDEEEEDYDVVPEHFGQAEVLDVLESLLHRVARPLLARRIE